MIMVCPECKLRHLESAVLDSSDMNSKHPSNDNFITNVSGHQNTRRWELLRNWTEKSVVLNEFQALMARFLIC